MDRTAVGALYEQHKNGIFRYALSILKDPQLAEDVLHDSFVKLLSVKPPREPQAWLYRVARNLSFDLLRKAKREQPQTQLPSQPDTQYAFIDLIAALSPQDREIVTLKIVVGLTHKEIGNILGISGKAAQKRYERALAELREKED